MPAEIRPDPSPTDSGPADGLVQSSLFAGLPENVPNPFNPMTTMRFDLAQTAHVKLEGYDVGGWRVRTLVDDVRSQERHAIAWNGSDDDGRPVASGLYSYRLATGDYAKSRRIVLLR